jgi:Fe-S cluster assembly protein SufD
MVQVLATNERYQSDFIAFEKGLADGDSEWVQRTRRQALSRFMQLGFPTARRGNERWKYTNVAPIAQTSFHYQFDNHPKELLPEELRQGVPWDEDWINLVFINGRYSQALSTSDTRFEGMLATNLAEAVSRDESLLKKHLAQYASFENDSFTALNTAFLQDGAFIHLEKGESLPFPLHLIFVSTDTGESIASYPRTLVVAGPHSKMTVIESYIGLSEAQYFTNSVVEMVLEDGAEVEHYRVLKESPNAFHVGTSKLHQGQDSTFSSTSFATGSALCRYDLYALLDGTDCSCFLNGLYLTSGTQHMDNYLNIDHAKPHGTSRLNYKGILDGKSRAVFGGVVLVRKDAQKTNAQQSDKNLLLSAEAEVDSKPGLLIYADDVKCGHGATAGQIGQEALFYMRSRGLDQNTARGLLIQGFANEIIQTVQLSPLRDYLDRLFLKALPGIHGGAVL